MYMCMHMHACVCIYDMRVYLCVYKLYNMCVSMSLCECVCVCV